jgi:hypothetical protein
MFKNSSTTQIKLQLSNFCKENLYEILTFLAFVVTEGRPNTESEQRITDKYTEVYIGGNKLINIRQMGTISMII